uniref:NACHT, LRR and PYD domains-containing protein 12 isoform X2 n=1 Tax=Arvicanthis niloticus TaxID=61156 RepID=UPI001485CFFE|nr:NACHT, LRR and PYD domains-containing protein 12 isoform X2 [Arvicanthis niloticus]
MLPATAKDGLHRLSTYLEELEAGDLKKFKLYLGIAEELGQDKIPWGRMEMAGPLEMAQLMVAHMGTREAWLLALSTFERIHRKDLWERGQGEDLVRVTQNNGLCSLESQSACLLDVSSDAPRKDPQTTYKDYVRRKFRLMEDRNARLGECVNLSHRYTQLLLVKEHTNPIWAQKKLLDIGWGYSRTRSLQASPIQMETLFEPDEERPEPPRTVVIQGAAGMGKSMLAHKVMLDWADGRLFQGQFDFVFYISCKELNRSHSQCSVHDLISSCWPEFGAPLEDLIRAPDRLLFIIDGFDKLHPSFHDAQGPWCLCWEEKRPTELLLGSIIRRLLLPQLSLLITTRPCALEKLHGLLEHPRHVEILGFSEAERKEYFYRYFHNTGQASQVFTFMMDYEPLFTMCFVPMVSWVVCTCLKQHLESGELLRPTSRTTTAVYMFYLLSLMQPKPGTPTFKVPANQKGLVSLAAEGLWNQKILFDEQDLGKHGLDGADVSTFLNVNIFQKDIKCEKFYSFIHLSFQEFFAAMYCALHGRDAVRRVLVEYGFSERNFLALTVRFLFGLLNEEMRCYLERNLGWTISPQVKEEALAWIQNKAQSEGSTLQHGSLELLSCLYEIQEEDFIQQALSHFQVVVVRNISTKMEHVVCSFCVRYCRSTEVLHLYGSAYSTGTEDDQPEPSGAQSQSARSQERNILPDIYSAYLSAAVCTNSNLIELALYRNALGSQGVRLLCQGLRHANCKLQNLRLKRCQISTSACQDLAAAVIANRNLIRLDLSGNSLGVLGLELLCEGLRHPRCRLQMIQLRKCLLEAAAGQVLASVLSSNSHLVELDLTGNPLEDLGLKLLCQGLRHPVCRLRTLWLKICHLRQASCEDLAATLKMNQSLMELDLGLNDLEDSGVLLLCEGLRHPDCKLQTLRLDSCGLTSKACEDLASTLGISQTLNELYLTNNALGDSGVWQLCKRLRHPGCKLRVLWLFGMDLNKMTLRRIAALRVTKPYLDIGC